MPFPTATKNAWLAGQDIDFVSLHSGFPGTTGANEISGGTPAYARQAASLGAASGGQRLLSASATWNVPPVTVRFIGLWKSGVFVAPAANGGGVPRNFIAIPSTDIIYAAAHGWLDGQKIVFFGVPPGGISEGIVCFVRDATADNFKVSATLGGPAQDLTTAASFGCVVVSIVEDVYASQGTHTLTTATVTVPD
jgi:hypothetical protein